MSEEVWFHYKNYKPRVEVNFYLRLHTVPIIGDVIHCKPEHIVTLLKSLKDREHYMRYGIAFTVLKREKILATGMGEDWRIKLQPLDPRLMNSKAKE